MRTGLTEKLFEVVTLDLNIDFQTSHHRSLVQKYQMFIFSDNTLEYNIAILHLLVQCKPKTLETQINDHTALESTSSRLITEIKQLTWEPTWFPNGHPSNVWLVSCALVRLNAIEEFIFRGTIDKFFRPISPPINSTLSDTKPIEPRTRESTYPVVNIFNPPIKKVDSSVESPSSNAHTEQR
ncbi:hypothetical protein HZH66_015483 [Vespula vulgaris]|uniref:Uncharacterized protein n=1 Tax=Vespula vulgaris TaxID=7454 RepID=A0A834IWR8_VESVU|nr:hypothetical protein HZH66_015483 [Vespula vulgaris]